MLSGSSGTRAQDNTWRSWTSRPARPWGIGRTRNRGSNMQKIITLLIVALVPPVVAVPIRDKENGPPKHFSNSIGMKFVWIPPGNFIMGSPKEEKERKPDEIQHKVTLTKGFYMGVYAVTQEEWQAVMGKNPSFFNKGEKKLPVERVR